MFREERVGRVAAGAVQHGQEAGYFAFAVDIEREGIDDVDRRRGSTTWIVMLPSIPVA